MSRPAAPKILLGHWDRCKCWQGWGLGWGVCLTALRLSWCCRHHEGPYLRGVEPATSKVWEDRSPLCGSPRQIKKPHLREKHFLFLRKTGSAFWENNRAFYSFRETQRGLQAAQILPEAGMTPPRPAQIGTQGCLQHDRAAIPEPFPLKGNGPGNCSNSGLQTTDWETLV